MIGMWFVCLQLYTESFALNGSVSSISPLFSETRGAGPLFFSNSQPQVQGITSTLNGCARICVECGLFRSDPPSKLCPGCQTYKEHQK